MADDDATPSNPPVAPIQQEELEEAPLDLNFSTAVRKRTAQESSAHSSRSFGMGSSIIS